jgi:hypothetical protein
MDRKCETFYRDGNHRLTQYVGVLGLFVSAITAPIQRITLLIVCKAVEGSRGGSPCWRAGTGASVTARAFSRR